MNITYLITGLGLGGAEVVTINLANLMVEQGHRVQFIYLNGDNQHSERIHPAIACFGLDMHKSPWGLVRALFKARRSVRRFGPDVVHAQMFHANIFVRLLRLITRIKVVVCSEHSYDIGGRLRMRIYRYTDFLSDINTNVSREATERFVREKAFRRKNSTTMYNGIECRKFAHDSDRAAAVRTLYGIADDEILLLNAGRLTAAKNQANLLRAFAWAHERNPKLRLVVIGKGELRDTLQQQIEQLGISSCAVLAGAHTNVADYYGAADVFVMSSDWEGMPMTILEAMASGCPIVTTDAGGADETVADRRWIVPTGESQQLGECLLRMAELSAQERRTIGERNLEASRAFDFSVVGRRWEELYRSGKL
ncbi:MAG: glycosyltransferase [Rikenellaceae bacterium]|nr:glycosyltransferase [Rikenellaceae bacterium]